jgi:hypothetical protein
MVSSRIDRIDWALFWYEMKLEKSRLAQRHGFLAQTEDDKKLSS